MLGLTLATAQAAVLENANFAIEIDDATYAVRSIVNKKAGGVKSIPLPSVLPARAFAVIVLR